MTSPQTPIHSRQASNADFPHSPTGSSPTGRRNSRSSYHEPSTPLRHSFAHQDGLDLGVFASGGAPHDMAASGIGNLADELADAYSDDNDDQDDPYYDDNGDVDHEDGPPGINYDLDKGSAGPNGVEGVRDSGVEVQTPGRKGALNLPTPNGRGHRRTGSEYDGSEYGSDSDLDPPGLPPSLVAKIDAVEHLVRRGTENTGGHADGVFHRVTDNLRDLGSQAGVEGNASRLITAHSALGTHLSHQNRQFHSLAYSVCNPLLPPPDEETVDSILPLLASLSESMPRPTTTAHEQLAALHSITSDLVQTLNYMSDTLHMARQATTTATRRLKSAKELVAEMRREDELREEGEEWLTSGNWSERLKKRECAHICGDVVGGFEEVCNSWRARLLAQGESQA